MSRFVLTAELFAREEPGLHRHLEKRVGKRAPIDDLVQEVAIALLTSDYEERDGITVTAFIRGVADLVAAQHLKGRTREKVQRRSGYRLFRRPKAEQGVADLPPLAGETRVPDGGPYEEGYPAPLPEDLSAADTETALALAPYDEDAAYDVAAPRLRATPDDGTGAPAGVFPVTPPDPEEACAEHERARLVQEMLLDLPGDLRAFALARQRSLTAAAVDRQLRISVRERKRRTGAVAEALRSALDDPPARRDAKSDPCPRRPEAPLPRPQRKRRPGASTRASTRAIARGTRRRSTPSEP